MSESKKEDMEVTAAAAPTVGVASADENLKPGSPIDGKSPVSSPASVISSPNKDSDTSYDRVDMEEIKGLVPEDINFHKVMQKMCNYQYDIKRNQEQIIFLKCHQLFRLDYKTKVVMNNGYCQNYPTEIFVPVAMQDERNQKLSINFDVDSYVSLVKEGPEARLRSRFVVPVIAFDNKFICRSGTLTVPTTALYEKLMGITMTPALDEEPSILKNVTNTVLNVGAAVYETYSSISNPEAMIKLFKNDLKIIKLCKVGHVFDLMVEYKKTYKETLELSSTEKKHEDIYGELKLEEMPFPGCEFFTQYSEAGRNGEEQAFDWENSEADRCLKLTENPVTSFPEIVVDDFKTWKLNLLTKNYLKIMLSYLVNGTEGVVVHCISGWDRTPLFIALLRLSLWADGVIHESLEYSDIAYLSVAYDWFLFGHNLPDRIRKHEEVMHFCYNFLEQIVSDEFSITRLFEELPPEKKVDRSFPKFVPGRRDGLLRKVKAYVLEVYEEMTAKMPEEADGEEYTDVTMEEA